MKIEMKDLDEALSCNRALFSEGDELSENVVERICYSDEPERPSNKQLKQLTENMVRVGNLSLFSLRMFLSFDRCFVYLF